MIETKVQDFPKSQKQKELSINNWLPKTELQI
jgi:hypothetical protein